MQKNIVVLGAGFGGLRCALELARKVFPEWKVVLVDRSAYHLYSPRLYDTAIPDDLHDRRGDEEMEKSQIAIAEILRGTRMEFVQGEIRGIDCKKKVVRVAKPLLNLPFGKGEKSGEEISFEYLVLALGAGTDYFGIEGLEKYACTLKSVEDAACIRGAVTEFLNTHNSPQPSLNLREGDQSAPPLKVRGGRGSYDKPFSIMIGGAGATGVEVAAELAYLFRKIPCERWSVTLVEALSGVLWMFPPEVGKYAYQRLAKLGVQVMFDTCIKSVRKNNNETEVVLAPRPLKPGESETALVCDFLPEHEKRVSADLLIWAGGVRATPLLSRCALPVDRKGRMEVDEYLRVKNFDNVFAIGDDATLINPKDQKPVPATAQAALEQGRLVAENVTRLIKAKGLSFSQKDSPLAPSLTQYHFHDFPAVIPLGGHDGVAYVGGRVFTGLLTWFLCKAADWRYLASILGWWRAVKMVSVDLRTLSSSKSGKT